jgi:hypothetical protein
MAMRHRNLFASSPDRVRQDRGGQIIHANQENVYSLPKNRRVEGTSILALSRSADKHTVQLLLSVSGNDCGRVCTFRAIAVAVDEENIAFLSLAEASTVL